MATVLTLHPGGRDKIRQDTTTDRSLLKAAEALLELDLRCPTTTC
jgi:hypothetical protein